MILFCGLNGITAWELRAPKGRPRQLVCRNDNFIIEIPLVAPDPARATFIAANSHSEGLNGRTLSVSELGVVV